jgi:hypothetical protein
LRTQRWTLMAHRQYRFDLIRWHFGLVINPDDQSRNLLPTEWHQGNLPDLREWTAVFRQPTVIEESVKGGVESDSEVNGFHELNVRLEVMR